jgi:hypothetical protein
MAAPPSIPTPDATGSDAASQSLVGLHDTTEYEFGSPSKNRKVLLHYSPSILDAGGFSQFVEETERSIEEYFHAKLLSRQTSSIPSGEVVSLVFATWPEPGQSDDMQLWVGLVHFRHGDTVTLNLFAKKDDAGAQGEYERLLKSLRKNPAERPLLAAVRQSMRPPVAGGPTSFPANAVSLELADDYLRPTTFHFATPSHESITLKVTGDQVADAVPAVPGAIVSHLDSLGKPVRVRKSRPLWDSRPSAKKVAMVAEVAPALIPKSKITSIQFNFAGKPLNLQVSIESEKSDVGEWAKAIQEELNKQN